MSLFSSDLRPAEITIAILVEDHSERLTSIGQLALNTLETYHQLPPYELENRLSLDEYFVSFVKKYQPQYSETELTWMLGISRKNPWEKRQRLDIPARKQNPHGVN